MTSHSKFFQALANIVSVEGKENDKRVPLRNIAEPRPPLQRLPQNLKDQIQCQNDSPSKDEESICISGKRAPKRQLQQVLRSNSSRWMRPKGTTPEKKDMKSILERQLGTMRWVVDYYKRTVFFDFDFIKEIS